MDTRLGFRRMLLTVAAGLLLGVALPASAGAFDLQPVTAAVHPNALAAGSDGSVWFTEDHAVGRIDARGRVHRLRTWGTDGEPFGITRGPDGAMWFIDYRGRWVGRATAGADVRTFPTGAPDGTFLTGIASGPDGALWVGSLDKVGRMTTDGTLTWFALPAGAAILSGPATGPDGRAWFVGQGSVLAVGAGGVIDSYPLAGQQSGGSIAAGPDGRMWVTGGNGVWAVSTSGAVQQVSTASVRTALGRPALVSGPSRHLWAAQDDDGTVAEITTAGRITRHGPGVQRIVSPTAFAPIALAVAGDGTLWLGGSGGVQRAVLRPACAVPDVTLRTASTARARLAAAGCTATVVRPRGVRPASLRVLRQSVRAGQVLRRGARVRITLGRPRPACRFPEGASTVVRSADVVVAVRTVRAAPLTPNSLQTRTWWTCLASDHRVRRLDQIQGDDIFGFLHDLGPFSVTGTRVTYVDRNGDHYNNSTSTIVTRDLASGAAPVSFVAGRAEDFGYPPYWVGSLVANAQGDIAWLATDSAVELRAADGARRVLATGAGLASVRIDATTVRWTKDGAEQSAPIRP